MSNPPPLRAITSAKPSPERQLESWKEIAAHLGRTIRTVQRWEQTEGLPVHRHEHHKRSSVYAYTADLDKWWQEYKDRLGREDTEVPQKRGWVRLLQRVKGTSARTRVAVVLLLLGVMSLAGYWYIGMERRAALPLSSGDWVLVTDFANQTGEPIFERSLGTAFAVALQQSPHVNLIPQSRVESTLKLMRKGPETKIDEIMGLEICLRQNARGLIAASVAKIGSQYVVSARLVDPGTGTAVRSYSERAANQERVLDALGSIAASVRKDLGESLASIRQRNQPLPAVTTASLQALELYSEGRKLWRKGSYREAIKLYESALTNDDCFAMVHEALGAAFFSYVFNNPARGKEHYEKALQCSDRVTERERLLIQASYQRDLGHFNEAVPLYRAYLQLYPDDSAMRYNFGTLLMRNRHPEEAIEQLKEVIRLDPRHASAFVNIATSYRQLGRSDHALPYYGKAFEAEPGLLDTVVVVHEYAFGLVHAGNPTQARAVLTKAAEKSGMRASMLRSLALVDMSEGRYLEAKPKLEESIQLSETHNDPVRLARGHLFMAILLSGSGDRLGEIRELEQAARAMTPKSPVGMRCRVGAFFARAGMVDRAERLARELGPQVDTRSLQDASSLHLLQGEAASARKKFPRALELLSLSDREASSPETLASLADAHRRAGNSAQAIAFYEKLISEASAALGWEVQQSWIEAHVRLAELYLSANEYSKAAAILEVLGRLWAHADPGLPLNREMVQLRKQLQSADRSSLP